MSLSTITLTTNKSIAIIGDERRRVRQSEKGLVLPVILLNANGEAYDLTDKSLLFSETKKGGKAVIDDGKGADSGIFTITDAKAGKFTYTLQAQTYTESGVCWFEILTGNTVVDTTKDFYIDVEKDTVLNPTNDSYISRMVALEESLNAASDRASASLKEFQDKYNGLISEWNTQKSAIQKQANDQLASIKQVDQNTVNATIKSITDKRDAALSQLNSEKQKAISNLQTDYNSWKTKTITDFEARVKPVEDKINQNSTQLNDVNKKVADAVAKFNSVDFTHFAKLSDVYTKAEVDNKLSTAGAVKTVDGINPDSKGNVQTDHYNKKDTDTKLSTKITFKKFDSPQAAYDASAKPASDGSIVIGVYDPDDGPTEAIIGDKKITLSSLHDSLTALQTQVNSLSNLQSIVDGKADTANVVLKTDFDNTINQLKASIATAGQVKTVNGAKPDSNGNVAVNIPKPDLSGYAKKIDLNGLAKSSDLSGLAKSSDLAGFAKKTDLSNLATKDDVKNVVKSQVISKSDYDKLKNKGNMLYYVTE